MGLRIVPVNADELPENFQEGYGGFHVEGFPEGFFEGTSAPLSSDESYDGGHVLDETVMNRLMQKGIVPTNPHLRAMLRNDGFHLLEHVGHVSLWAVPTELVPLFRPVMGALAEAAEIPPHVREALFYHYKGEVDDYHDTLAEYLPKLAREVPSVFKAPDHGYAYRFVTGVDASDLARMFKYDEDHFTGRKGVIVGGTYAPHGQVTSWSTSLKAVLDFAHEIRGGKRTKGSKGYYDVILVASLGQEGFYLNPNKAPHVCSSSKIKGCDIAAQREVVSLGPVILAKSVWQRMAQYESEQPVADPYNLPRTPVNRLRTLLKPRRQSPSL